MANQYLTTSLITREILSVLRQKFTFLNRINMEYSDEFAVTRAGSWMPATWSTRPCR